MKQTSSGASLRETGSHPTDQAPAGLGASRFDPARMERKLAEIERAEKRLARMRGEVAAMVRVYSDANGFRVRLSRPDQVLADIAAKERAAA